MVDAFGNRIGNLDEFPAAGRPGAVFRSSWGGCLCLFLPQGQMDVLQNVYSTRKRHFQHT